MSKNSLKHTVLYAKGWYKTSDDVWKDIKTCLKADDYLGQGMSNWDVIEVITRNLNRVPNVTIKHYMSPIQIMSGLSPENKWKTGFTKDEPYDYLKSVLGYLFSVMRQLTRHDFEVVEADYVNVLPERDEE